MSEVKVNKVSPRSGTGLQLGDSGDTITIPSGATLANSGTATGFASIEWQSSIVTATTLTAEAGKGYWIDTTSNACTVTFPGSASVGDRIILTDYARNWGSNAVTINQNGLNFQGNSSPNPVYDTDGESVDIVYSGTTKGWIPNNDGAVAFETVQTYDVQYLVVAGGGAGGGYYGGGGGAGGYLTATLSSLAVGITITATVGAGGASVAGSGGPSGNNGVNSTLVGSGFSTVTAVGGGGGGADNGPGGSAGGSGGGGAGSTGSSPTAQGGGAGTSPQGNNGGTGAGPSGAPHYVAGGGGGAGAVGTNGAGSSGGDGGVGVSNSITGSAVFYAGGGGGSSENTSSKGPGGNGGGGTGGFPGTAGVAGTDNLGGGGGGANQTEASGKGGTGVIILSVPDADYSGTVTGSPTVTTGVSGKTIIKFTGTGTYVT